MTVNTLKLSTISEYLGTVDYGKVAGRSIAEMWDTSYQIICDFDNVHGMTGAFADEAFGRMFTEKGSEEFSDKVRFYNLNELVEAILKGTLYQRYKDLKNPGHWSL